MHLEIDAWEIIAILFTFYAFKWLFRLVFIVFLLKILEGVKKKGAEKANELRQSFTKNFEQDEEGK